MNGGIAREIAGIAALCIVVLLSLQMWRYGGIFAQGSPALGSLVASAAQSSYTISITSADFSDDGRTLAISGPADILNYAGERSAQYVRFDWGDGKVETVQAFALPNYRSYIGNGYHISLHNYSRSHTYARAGGYTVRVTIQRGKSSTPKRFGSFEIQTENTAVRCADNLDNDKDGQADFSDADCVSFIPLGTLRVVNTVINNHGGTKATQDFGFRVDGSGPITFEADGQNDVTVSPGTYTVIPLAMQGYGASITDCTVSIENGGMAICAVTYDDVPPPRYGGVYVASKHLDAPKKSFPDSLYTMPQVDGVVIRASWSNIEPAQGVYDWTLVDKELMRAIAAGKRVALSVTAGNQTPPWVFDLGVPKNIIVTGPHDGLDRCGPYNIPSPWDPVFLEQFTDMVRALSSHVRSVAGAYDALRMVKITGINQDTIELRLPASNGVGTGDCEVSNAIDIWQAAGYTPQNVLDAWRTIATAFGNAFPDKILTIDVLQNNDFPPISNSGEIVKRTSPEYVDVKAAVVTDALARFPRRFAMQWDGLSTSTPAASVIDAGQRGAIVGWQTNLYLGNNGGTGCGSPGIVKVPATPCDEAGYEAILQNGVNNQAKYLEIWLQNLEKFPDAVGRIQAQLSQY